MKGAKGEVETSETTCFPFTQSRSSTWFAKRPPENIPQSYGQLLPRFSLEPVFRMAIEDIYFFLLM